MPRAVQSGEGLAVGQLDKVLQQLQADFLAFLRVKLRGEHIVAPDGRRKVVAVVRARGDDGRVHRLRIKAVHEINVAAAGDAAIERTVGFHDLQLVPADLRNLVAGLLGEADDFALKYAETGGAGIEFLALLEQRLVADADAEKRFAGRDEFFCRIEQFLLPERVDAVVERADLPSSGSFLSNSFITMVFGFSRTIARVMLSLADTNSISYNI